MGHGVFIIAEAGSNWRLGSSARDTAMGKALIECAAEAGADAVKFQTYRPETVYVPNAGTSNYLRQGGEQREIGEIFADLAMPYEMIPVLARHAAECGLEFMSTPFSRADFAALDPFVRTHKIASYEISHLRLLQMTGASGKPLILSTGASTMEDIAWAVDQFRRAGGADLTLLQCTAKYPAPPESLNLRVLSGLAAEFGLPVGLSDHSRHPLLAPVAAVAMGAVVIEKHFTLHNRLPGPDHAFAVTAEELKQMVQAVRIAEEMLGSEVKAVFPQEKELALFARRGLQAIRDIAPGEALQEGVNFDILRPGNQKPGLHPRHLERIQGRTASRHIALGSGLDEGDWI